MKRFIEGEISWSRNLILATFYKVAERTGLGVPHTLEVKEVEKGETPTTSCFRVYPDFGHTEGMLIDPIIDIQFGAGLVGKVKVSPCLEIGTRRDSYWRIEVKPISLGRTVIKVKRWRFWHRLKKS